MDWETELAIVIGQRCKYVEAASAHEVIAGYCILNDVSDRHWQTDHSGQFTLVTQAKSFDTFAPLGPHLVTPDEIANPDALAIKLWVNGVQRQDFNSSDYIYGVREAVAFCSQFFTLYPGDVIAMGSGPGNGFTWNEYLKIGDQVTASIDGLGIQEFSIVEEV
jgi:2-keto-4-pentenoate hydratase/2-oxohepta-3-ene-1,7-dioic acid hydratase in catechol pathway